ncbi:hypothetical protein CDAR_472071 [Caerostris darwini]|uniref:Uncharacterized protein n=1 Tax=Caerostris darwini TaxID=1538125 RepID=A0AAV4VL02_9ARAC|nr:hypothetical protein CDAR_472071 [Caerostris darwini]
MYHQIFDDAMTILPPRIDFAQVDFDSSYIAQQKPDLDFTIEYRNPNPIADPFVFPPPSNEDKMSKIFAVNVQPGGALHFILSIPQTIYPHSPTL